jgi:competence protein ComEA
MKKIFASVILIVIACSASSAQDVSSTYAARCANCHGADGSGNTALGRALKLHDLRSPDVKKVSQLELATIIAKGMDRGRMPGFEKKLGTDMVVQLAAYVQSIDSQAAVPQLNNAKTELGSKSSDAQGAYAAKCAHCHGADGSGETIWGRRLKLRDMRSLEVQQYPDSRLAAIIATGTDQGRMPGFQKKLGPELVEQLASYVRILSGGAPIVATKTAISAESGSRSALPNPVRTATAAEDKTSATSQPEIQPEEERQAERAAKLSTFAKVSSAIIPAGRGGPKAELVDLNSASKELLMTLPGITEADAANIIGSRPYKSSLQFKTRRIVPPETYERIADRVIAKQSGRTKQRFTAENAVQETSGGGSHRAMPVVGGVVKY